jgi:hypothetical protein
MTDRGGETEIGMDKMEIRHMLRIAGGEPLHAAVALSREGRAIILLDRHKPPRTLERELREGLPDSRLHRFGTLSVGEDDPRLARFVVNRSSPGMAKKLAKALKGTGLRRVEIGTEDGSESESAEDDEPEDDAIQVFGLGARPDHPRHAELHDELRALLEQAVRVAGARRMKLLEIAEAARTELKQDRLEAAAKAIATLRQTLGETA